MQRLKDLTMPFSVEVFRHFNSQTPDSKEFGRNVDIRRNVVFVGVVWIFKVVNISVPESGDSDCLSASTIKWTLKTKPSSAPKQLETKQRPLGLGDVIKISQRDIEDFAMIS